MTDAQEQALHKLIHQVRLNNRQEYREQIVTEIEWAIAEIKSLQTELAARRAKEA